MRFSEIRSESRCFYILKIRNAARSGKALRTYAAALHQSAARPRRASDGASASPAQLRPVWCAASDCPPLLPVGANSAKCCVLFSSPGAPSPVELLRPAGNKTNILHNSHAPGESPGVFISAPRPADRSPRARGGKSAADTIRAGATRKVWRGNTAP